MMTDPTQPKTSAAAIDDAPLHEEIARLREERSTLEQAFADICEALGCERDNESSLFAVAQLREKAMELAAAQAEIARLTEGNGALDRACATLTDEINASRCRAEAMADTLRKIANTNIPTSPDAMSKLIADVRFKAMVAVKIFDMLNDGDTHKHDAIDAALSRLDAKERDASRAAEEELAAALQKIGMALGSSDEWTDRGTMISDVLGRFDASRAVQEQGVKDGNEIARLTKERDEAKATITELREELAHRNKLFDLANDNTKVALDSLATTRATCAELAGVLRKVRVAIRTTHNIVSRCALEGFNYHKAPLDELFVNQANLTGALSALDFRVGGDECSVNAKAILREIAAREQAAIDAAFHGTAFIKTDAAGNARRIAREEVYAESPRAAAKEVVTRDQMAAGRRAFSKTYVTADAQIRETFLAMRAAAPADSVSVEAHGVRQKCAATISTDPPQDCNWPFCGCDATANRVLETLQECGLLKSSDPAIPDPGVESLVEALKTLEVASTKVANMGATTGPQWTRLTGALLVARAALAKWRGGK